MPDLRYPIGPFMAPESLAAEVRAVWIAEIASAPAHLRAAVAGLSEAQLDTPYRDGGWTVRQVAHHLGDSHVVAYTRMKYALTEGNPPVRSYDEERWAALPDYASTPIEVSLILLEALHARWVVLMRGLSEEQLLRTYQHSSDGKVSLSLQLALYSWHGRHHVSHIKSLRERMHWKYTE